MPKEVSFTLVELNPADKEYRATKTKFEESMHASQKPVRVHMLVGQYSQMIKIHRVQNTMLLSQYIAKKNIMDKKNPPGTINEVVLFHGCPRNVVDKISHHGYNRSFAGKNGKPYAYLYMYISCSTVLLYSRVYEGFGHFWLKISLHISFITTLQH